MERDKVDLIKNPDNLWRLYQLEEDRSEDIDLAARHPEILGQLDDIVRKAHKPSHVEEWNFVERIINKK